MSYRSESVVSADGTAIAYRAYGSGSTGVVLIHGGGGAAQSFDQLAEALAPSFSVFVPDRRGRGKSGPFGAQHSLATECADLEALLRETKARAVFGLSSGAVIALFAASKLATIQKLAVYEPPLIFDGIRPEAWASRFERELDRGRPAAAMVTALKGTGDVRSVMTYVPRAILRPLFGLAMRRERPQPDRIPFRELVPTLREDIKLVREAEPLVQSFTAIRSDMLLLGGARSARDLRLGLAAFGRLVPRAARIVLPRVGHTAAMDDGKPELVAHELRAFFAGS